LLGEKVDVFYLRIVDRNIEGLQAEYHIPWATARDNFFKPKEAAEEVPLWLVDTSDSNLCECLTTQVAPGANTVNIYLPEVNRWLVIPIHPGKYVSKRLQCGWKPIKVYITRYSRGRKSKLHWYLALVLRAKFRSEKSKYGLFTFRGLKVSLRPKSLDDLRYLSDEDIDKKAKLLIMGYYNNYAEIPDRPKSKLPEKKDLRPIVDGPLPLPYGSPTAQSVEV